MTTMRSAALLIILLSTVCCSPAPPSSEDVPLSVEPIVTGTVKAEDGISLLYDTGGQGTTALVFIHCWACDRTFWRGQLGTFAGDYRVVALDLGGHGRDSDASSLATAPDRFPILRLLAPWSRAGSPPPGDPA